nr:hypothetical protein [Tanacetum cinerariifolium]
MMIYEIDFNADVVLEEAKDVDVAADMVKDVQDVKESAHDQGRKAKSQTEIYKIDLKQANKVLSMQEEELEPAKVQEVVDVVITAKIITNVVTAASDPITTASTTITATEAQVPAVTLTAAPSRVTVAPKASDLLTHTTKYTSPALTQKVLANMRRVGKWFFRVETPIFEGMLVAQEITKGEDEVPIGDDNVAKGDVSAADDIIHTKVRTAQRIDTSDDTVINDVSNQGMMIYEIDFNADVVLEEAKDVDVAADMVKDVQDVKESAHDQGRKAKSQTEIHKIDLKHANKVLSMQEEELEPAKVQEVVDVVITAKIITNVVTAASDPITTASITITATKAQVPAVTLTAAPSRVTVAPSRGRKGVTKEHIEEKESRALKRLNETLAEKAAKRKKLDEVVEELKRHLHIVPNEEDDVYTESTPLALKVNDVMRLQALVDKKKVVVMEATIRDALWLDDAECVDCLPNEEIFIELARMGYEKPFTKLTFYKAFFSSQKQVGDLSLHSTKHTSLVLTQKVFANMRRIEKGYFRVETPLFEGMIVEQQVNEGDAKVNVNNVSTAGVAAEGDVSAANDEVPAVVEEPSISSPTPPTQSPPPSQDIPSTSQVQPTLPQSPQAQQPTPQQQPQPSHDAGISMDLLQNLIDTCTNLTRRVKHLEQDKITQALEITKLKSRVKKLERKNKASKLNRLKKVRSTQRINTSDDTVMDDISNQERMIADVDVDADVVLKEAKDVAVDIVKNVQDADVEDKPGELQEVVDVVTTAKIIIEVVTAASDTITAASITITTVDAQIPTATLTAAPLRVTAAPRRRK